MQLQQLDLLANNRLQTPQTCRHMLDKDKYSDNPQQFSCTQRMMKGIAYAGPDMFALSYISVPKHVPAHVTRDSAFGFACGLSTACAGAIVHSQQQQHVCSSRPDPPLWRKAQTTKSFSGNQSKAVTCRAVLR